MHSSPRMIGMRRAVRVREYGIEHVARSILTPNFDEVSMNLRSTFSRSRREV